LLGKEDDRRGQAPYGAMPAAYAPTPNAGTPRNAPCLLKIMAKKFSSANLLRFAIRKKKDNKPKLVVSYSRKKLNEFA
jgi:hypothetical protein